MTCPKLQPTGQGIPGPVVVVVMDGIGIGRGDAGDAVAAAHTPNLDRYAQSGFATRLRAHGTAVGLPSDADMGNSEVGHNALGAGRVFAQGAKLVGEAIASGDLFRGPVWHRIVARCLENNTPLHLVGLLSDGNVHSHIDHVKALVQRADAEGIGQVYLHALLDGRDVPKTSALEYIDEIEAVLHAIDARPQRRYRIASGGGRMTTTMDRYESDWSVVERGWKAHVLGQGRGFASAREAVEIYRAEQPGIGDQDLPSFVVLEDDRPVGRIEDGSAVIAFNFRGDRMLELTRTFEEQEVPFERERRPDVLFAGMTLYDGDTGRPKNFLVHPPEIRCTFGEMLCEAGVGQLACSETQKFGHVTYFWNGNRSGYFDKRLERYIEVPSNPPPFDAKPEMRAEAITDTVIEQLGTGRYRFARLNFANGDMVGHTGNFDATVAAVEAVDRALGKLEAAVLRVNGALIVTADHGNADDMLERNKKTGAIDLDAHGVGRPKTSHSLNPVPFYVVLGPKQRERFALTDVAEPGLGHVAATAACLLGFARPEGFLPSLIEIRA